MGGRLLHRRQGGRPGRRRPEQRQRRRVLDRLPGRLANGPRLSGRLRPNDQRALHLAPPLRDLRTRPARLAAALPARPPRPARDRRRVWPLALLLQQGQHRGLGSARLPTASLPARASAVARLPARQGLGAQTIGPDRHPGGRHPRPDRWPGRPQRRRLERDRRRLLGGDRRRPDRGPQADLRQLPFGRPIGRHLRARRLLRLRPVRAGIPLERHLGRPARGPRCGDLLRPGDDGGALPARPPDPARPLRDGARGAPLLRLGRVPLHRVSRSSRTRTTRWLRSPWRRLSSV